MKKLLLAFLFIPCLAQADISNDNYLFNRMLDKLTILVPSTATRTSKSASTAFEASRVIKGSSGFLVSLSVYNSKASAQFILIMDSATVPADGAVTLLYPPIPIPASTLVMVTFPIPLSAATGISVSNSSTGSFTKTIGSADCAFVGQYQ